MWYLYNYLLYISVSTLPFWLYTIKICCWNELEYRELSDVAPKYPKISAYLYSQRTQLDKYNSTQGILYLNFIFQATENSLVLNYIGNIQLG